MNEIKTAEKTGDEDVSNETAIEKNDDPVKWYYIDKDMLLAKITYLFAGLEKSSTLPYVTMFYVSIGLNLKQVSYVSSSSYVGLMIGSVFWGVLADKTRAHRVLLLTVYILQVVFALSIPLVSSKIGEKEKNKCPISANKMFNINVTFNSTNKILVEDYNPVSSATMTYVIAVLGFFMMFSGGSIYSYIDAGVIGKIKMSTKPKNFGRQYMFSTLGFTLGTLISGQFMDIFPKVNLSCYFAVFSVSAAFQACSCISSQYLFRGIKMPSREEVRSDCFKQDLLKTLHNLEVHLFFITTFINGFLYTVYLNYFFLFMKELKSPNILIGLTAAFGSSSGVIINFFNDKIINLFRGTFKTMIMCTFIWSVRYFIFYFLENPWLVLPLQITLHGLSLSLFFCVKSVHLKLIAPNSINSTMFGITQCLHSGISAIGGSLIGGQLYFSYGARKLFLYVSLIAFGWTAFLCLYLVVKKILKVNTVELSNSTTLTESALDVCEYITKF